MAISAVRGCPRKANVLQTAFQYEEAYRHELFITIPAVPVSEFVVFVIWSSRPRNEGEAYARKLWNACVRVTATRFIGTMHGFVMLNVIAGGDGP